MNIRELGSRRVTAGWLKPLLSEFSGSFMKFADALIKAAPEFKETYKNVRSLETRLRWLDQGKDSSFFDDEEWKWVPPLLGKVLGKPVVELRRLMREQHAREQPHVVDLLDLSNGRPLDLRLEKLFPGIPDDVLEPETWGRPVQARGGSAKPVVWWFAPSGAGRKLVGRWLEARGLARFVRARSWRSADLPERGPVYLVLDEADDAAGVLPLPGGLCIAAPFSASEIEAKDGVSIREISTAPLGEWLDDLLVWVGSRLDPGGAFKRSSVKKFVEAHPYAFETPGQVLAFCDLVDRDGADKVTKGGFGTFARHYVEGALRRCPTLDVRLRRELERHADELLLGLVKGLLCQTTSDPEVGLPLDEFEGFLPERFRSLDDVAGVLALAADAKTNEATLRAKIRQKLGHGAVAVVGVLAEARILERHGGGVRLRPWVERLTTPDVLRNLVDEGGRDLGAAFLRAHAAPLVARELFDRFKKDDGSSLKTALCALAPADPVTVAAFEGAFRAAGLAVLCGAKLDPGLLSQAWDRQFEIAVPPTYEHESPLPLLGWDSGESWLSSGAWSLACLAISEQIKATAPAAFAVWRGTKSGSALIARLLDDAYWAAMRHVTSPPWLAHAFDLARRLFERGALAASERVLPDLARPAAIVQAVKEGRELPAWIDVTSFERSEASFQSALASVHSDDVDVRRFLSVYRAELPSRLDPLRLEAERHGLDVGAVVGALWRAWAKDARKPSPRFVSLPPKDGNTLWHHAPPDLFADRLFWAILDWTGGPRPPLTSEQWRMFLDGWRKNERAWGGHERIGLWNEVPEDAALEVTRQGIPDVANALEIGRVLWSRFPDGLMAQMIDGLDREPSALLIITMPPERGLELLDELRTRLGAREPRELPDRRVLVGWLQRYIAERRPRWESAYALLLEVKDQGAPGSRTNRSPRKRGHE